MESENSYHCLTEENIAFHIHLHTAFYAIYGACSLDPKYSELEVGRVK